jgi:hypothetical protein
MTHAQITRYHALIIARTVIKLMAKIRPLEHCEPMNWKQWTEYLLAEALDIPGETLTIKDFNIDEHGCITLRNP